MKETKVEDELYFCEIVDRDIYIYNMVKVFF